MRISDWSSDVCSSDLALAGKDGLQAPFLLKRRLREAAQLAGVQAFRRHGAQLLHRAQADLQVLADLPLVAPPPPPGQLPPPIHRLLAPAPPRPLPHAHPAPLRRPPPPFPLPPP